jgi:hypothetical protein
VLWAQETADSHLDQEGLELASKRIDIAEIISGHEGGNVGHHVAKRCVKYQAVDRFVERLREGKGDDDEDASQQREYRADALNNHDRGELLRG